ncbi:MAG TPA: hypothetical protein VI282_18750 [Verrucomicrobiae bacterium]
MADFGVFTLIEVPLAALKFICAVFATIGRNAIEQSRRKKRPVNFREFHRDLLNVSQAHTRKIFLLDWSTS